MSQFSTFTKSIIGENKYQSIHDALFGNPDLLPSHEVPMESKGKIKTPSQPLPELLPFLLIGYLGYRILYKRG